MKRGLIPQRIAFASKVDVSHCADVQEFIQKKVNYESYLDYARSDGQETLVSDTNVYEKWNLPALYSFFKGCLP